MILMDMNRRRKKTHSTSENRKPIHARGPPMNVIRFAQTPGTEEAILGIFSQRSGLEKGNISDYKSNKIKSEKNLNSAASSPQIDLSRLMTLIGIVTN